MKNDMIQYERIYRLLKSKIESGILPVGTRLSGRSVLCREFGTSERTIRHVLELLEQDGLIEIAPGKRPVVISVFATPEGRALQNTKKADTAKVNDLMQTAALLCDSIYQRGLKLCTEEDWQIPEKILQNMDPEKPEEFWQLSSRLWRFFIARNENELLLRTVDSLGFRGKTSPQGTLEDRILYRFHVKTLFQTVKNGGAPGRAQLNAIFAQYKSIAEQAREVQFVQLLPTCPMLAEADELGQQLSAAQERYSSVCLDLLGLIAIGRYQPGDRLPTHDQIQAYYGVSRDTSVRAIRMLQEWGVVTAAPRRGIYVMMNLEALKKIHIAPESIACHVRRYLDSLDLLALTVGEVAAHVSVHISSEQGERLRRDIIQQLEEPNEHQLIPRTLLDFITTFIPYESLRSVYEVLARNFSIGRGIPQLVSPEKNARNCGIYRRCIEASDFLIAGDSERFARTAADIYAQVQSLVSLKCKQLGYWEAAMQVYDGASLWQ